MAGSVPLFFALVGFASRADPAGEKTPSAEQRRPRWKP
jgi:hypothetical protein